LASWALGRIRLEGRPFSFSGHEYLRGIYNDSAGHVVVMKAAQVGGTTWAVLRSLHACISGLNVIYFFPTKSDVLEFSKSRVGPLVGDNEFLANLVNETDTAGLKRIGEALLYMRGMQSTVGMKSVPADMIVFDELDEATPQAKSMAKERLAHSSYKRIIELSNPSLPDFGIDEAYQLSDQRHWTVKCGCGSWVSPDKEFPTRLNCEVKIILARPDGTCIRACTRCGAELKLDQGEWVADFPGRAIHGYRISQLISYRVDPAEILNEYRLTRYADHFYNLKIGAPYSDLDRRLDLMSVLSLCGNDAMLDRSDDSCTMGVDTGRAFHVVILKKQADGRQRLVYLAICKTFEQLDELMHRFKVSRCVIDALPETHLAEQFARRHPGRVYLSYFVDSQKGSARWDHQERRVTINRTNALDASRSAVRDKALVLPRRDRQIELFAKHMTADAKKLEQDEETGAQWYKYIKTGENHFSFAFTYAWMAANCRRPGDGVFEFYAQKAREIRAKRSS
jgi:hypothetical protein